MVLLSHGPCQGNGGEGGRWFVSGDPKSSLDPSNGRCQ